MRKEIIIRDYDQSIVNKNVVLKIEDILNRYFINIENFNNFNSMRDVIPIIHIFAETYEYIVDKNKWDTIILHYMKLIRERIVLEGYNNRLSLFDGMAEIGNAVNHLNQKTGYYTSFLESVNKYILEKLPELIEIKFQNINNLKIKDFDCIEGISGIVSYLLNFEQIKESKIIYDCISYLIRVGSYKKKGIYEIPVWHIKADNIVKEDERKRFPQGYLNFSLSHGIGGVLVALSLALIKNIELSGQKDCINKILLEYKKNVVLEKEIVYWHGQLAYNNYISGESNNDDLLKRMSWCYGSIGILRAMKIGTYAVKDEENKIWIENNIRKISKLNTKDYGFTSPILCHGYAGLLTLLAAELRECSTPCIQEMVLKLTNIILETFQSDNIYMFDMMDYQLINGKLNLVPIYSNSLLEGAAGIILSLLSVIKETKWETQLLIK